MHAKTAEITRFLDKDLRPQVQSAFGLYKSADKAEIESDAVDIGALESEVYDQLFSFFRRYYSEGDFLARRVYKPGARRRPPRPAG